MIKRKFFLLILLIFPKKEILLIFPYLGLQKHNGGHYPMKRALVTTTSTRCTTGKQSCENMFFKNRKDNRQQDQK